MNLVMAFTLGEEKVSHDFVQQVSHRNIIIASGVEEIPPLEVDVWP
jgi:hypothetical protein